MDFIFPEQVKETADKFKKANYCLYLVGGALRDLLMKTDVKDWDFTTDAKPEEILKILPEGFYDNKFGTVGISFVLGVIEITTMRREGEYSDYRHPQQILWTNKIEEDLQRRDFTVNALALRLDKKSEIIDLFDGQRDIEKRLIKSVGDPDKRFNEDALRLIRAIRFATQLDFEIEEKTFQSLKKNAGLIHEISWERIRDEMLKILSTDNPYKGVVLLRESGMLGHILPEMERCFGVVQEGPKHDRVYDIGEHSLLSLRYCPSKDSLIRFATLIHDVGKPDTIGVQTDGNVTFYGHDVVGGKLAKQIGARFKLSNKQVDKLTRLVRWHLFSVDENQTDSAIRRFIRNVGQDCIDDMMDLRVGDRLGGGTQKAVSWRMKKFRERVDDVRKKPFSVTDLKVDGNDVMEILKISPSRKVGEVLDMLFKEVLEDASKNTREYLLKRIKSVA